jgi:hypothetical protein
MVVNLPRLVPLELSDNLLQVVDDHDESIVSGDSRGTSPTLCISHRRGILLSEKLASFGKPNTLEST